MRRAVRRVFKSNSFLSQVTTVLAGTGTAQVLTVLAMIPLARLYSPEHFGLFAIMQAIVVVGIDVGALRYNVAIVMPRSDLVARVLQRLASRSVMIASSVIALVLLLAQPAISNMFGDSVFAWWLPTAGIAVYLMTQILTVQYWLTRHQRYGVIAGNRLTQAALVAAFQIAAAPLIGGFLGLIVGLLLGQLGTLLLVRQRSKDLRGPLPADAPTMGAVAKRYRKMALVNGPNALVDGVQSVGINALIGNIALSGLGQYSLAYRITLAPVALLVGSLSQVLLQRLSTTRPGGMLQLLRTAFGRIFLFAVPIFAVFYLVAPYLFPFVFGAQWAEAGQIAQALVPWLFMLTFTSPLSSVFVIVEKQEWSLAHAVVMACAALGFLAFSPFDVLNTVRILALILAGMLLIWVAIALWVARGYDAKAEHAS